MGIEEKTLFHGSRHAGEAAEWNGKTQFIRPYVWANRRVE